MASQLTETEGYSHSKGLFSARKAIMQYGQLKHLLQKQRQDHRLQCAVIEKLPVFRQFRLWCKDTRHQRHPGFTSLMFAARGGMVTTFGFSGYGGSPPRMSRIVRFEKIIAESFP